MSLENLMLSWYPSLIIEPKFLQMNTLRKGVDSGLGFNLEAAGTQQKARPGEDDWAEEGDLHCQSTQNPEP